MNERNVNKKNSFKYNMSFYYQSTIIYIAVFIVYVIIRGEFIEDSFTLITKDPIIYFFAIIVLISLISLLYNIYKNKHIEVSEDGIRFINRFRFKEFKTDQIRRIKFSKKRDSKKRSAFRLVRIKLKNRRRGIIVRPYDYENEDQLIKRFQELKERVTE